MIKNFLKYHPIHKKIVKYLDLLFILRPSLFFPVWIMIASGMITSSMQNDRFRIWINEFNLNTFLVFLGVTIICGATFIINQMQDIVSDQENDKLVLFKEKMTQSTADRFYKILMIVSIIILIPTGVINIVLGLLLLLLEVLPFFMVISGVAFLEEEAVILELLVCFSVTNEDDEALAGRGGS